MMRYLVLAITGVGCLLVAGGCQGSQTGQDSARAAVGVDGGVPRPQEGGPASAVSAPPREPEVPEGQKLIDLFPADARDVLKDRKVTPDLFADWRFVPGSVSRSGDSARARVRQQSSGFCFVRRGEADGWSVWSRVRASQDLEKTRCRLLGVPADVRSCEDLRRLLEADPKRLLNLKVSVSGGEIGLAGFAGLRIDLDDFVKLEAVSSAEARDVTRLSLTALGRELPVVIGVALKADRWELKSLEQISGMPVAKFLEQALPPAGN